MESIIPSYKQWFTRFCPWLNDRELCSGSNETIIREVNGYASGWMLLERVTMIHDAYIESGLYTADEENNLYKLFGNDDDFHRSARNVYGYCNKDPSMMCIHDDYLDKEMPIEPDSMKKAFWQLRFTHMFDWFYFRKVFNAIVEHTRPSEEPYALEALNSCLSVLLYFALKDDLNHDQLQYFSPRYIAIAVDGIADALAFYLDDKKTKYCLNNFTTDYASNPKIRNVGINLHKLAELSLLELEVFSKEQAQWSEKLIQQPEDEDIQALIKYLPRIRRISPY